MHQKQVQITTKTNSFVNIQLHLKRQQRVLSAAEVLL